MTTKKPNDPGAQRLTPHLSPASAWALAVGTSIGWGSLVVTASGYLSQAGDTYICSACRLICEYYDHSPVFRIGGDEFAVLLRGQDYENRYRILTAINEYIEQNVGTNNVVASLGMAEFDPETDNTFHAVFTRADARMYERKQELKAMGARTRD